MSVPRLLGVRRLLVPCDPSLARRRPGHLVHQCQDGGRQNGILTLSEMTSARYMSGSIVAGAKTSLPNTGLRRPKGLLLMPITPAEPDEPGATAEGAGVGVAALTRDERRRDPDSH